MAHQHQCCLHASPVLHHKMVCGVQQLVPGALVGPGWCEPHARWRVLPVEVDVADLISKGWSKHFSLPKWCHFASLPN